MKRLAVIFLTILLIVGITACGSKNETSASIGGTASVMPKSGNVKADVSYDTASVQMEFTDDIAGRASEKAAVAQAAGMSGMDGGYAATANVSYQLNSSAANAILSGRKVIFNGYLTIEVENFNEAYSKIESMILGIGYVQSSSISRDRIYVEGKEAYITRGTIVIRVASDRFQAFMSGAEGIGEVLERASDSQDFTDRYFDTEARLKVLLLEEERLLSYLDKIDDPDAIFKYERRLTEVRQEIESLTGTLRKWDDLVELSTITLNLREKNPITESKEKTYLARLAKRFVDSISKTIYYFGEILIFVIQALPVLIILFVLGMASYKVFRKFGTKKKDTDT